MDTYQFRIERSWAWIDLIFMTSVYYVLVWCQSTNGFAILANAFWEIAFRKRKNSLILDYKGLKEIVIGEICLADTSRADIPPNKWLGKNCRIF